MKCRKTTLIVSTVRNDKATSQSGNPDTAVYVRIQLYLDFQTVKLLPRPLIISNGRHYQRRIFYTSYYTIYTISLRLNTFCMGSCNDRYLTGFEPVIPFGRSNQYSSNSDVGGWFGLGCAQKTFYLKTLLVYIIYVWSSSNVVTYILKILCRYIF